MERATLRRQVRSRRTIIGLAAAGLVGGPALACQVGAGRTAPVPVGLIAPLSGDLAVSGQAILRGMMLARDEINASGGVVGRPLTIVTQDVPQNDTDAGVAALEDLVRQHGIIAVFGGIYSPVMLGQLPAIHQLRIPLINPWGSVTQITHNGYQPNYAFRVSVSDDTADEFLARYATQVVGSRRPGIMADTSAWGESNVGGLLRWFDTLRVPVAGVQRFDQGETMMVRGLTQLGQSGADTILLIANAPEGAAIIRGLVSLGWHPPVISHWGLTGGKFTQLAGVDNAEGVLTLQTYSFMGPQSDTGARVLRAYHAAFGTRRPEEIAAPAGVAHGYDGLRLLASAIHQAQSLAGDALQAALQRLPAYAGLVKTYNPPFTADNHDALRAEDYLMAVWHNGELVPAAQARLPR